MIGDKVFRGQGQENLDPAPKDLLSAGRSEGDITKTNEKYLTGVMDGKGSRRP